MKINLQTEIANFLNTNSQNPQTVFETESEYISVDLLSEGPIEGFVNSNGDSVNYIGIGNGYSAILGQGIYYNNTPLVDKKTNFYNFSQAAFSTSFGNQFKNNVLYSSALYPYKTKICDFSYAAIKKYSIITPENISSTGSSFVTFNDNPNNKDFENYIKYKNYAFVVTHSVQNRYADSFEFNVSIDNLFNVAGDGSIQPGYASLIVNVENLSDNKNYYAFLNCSFVAKGGSIILPFIIKVEDSDRQSNKFPDLVLSVYSIRGSVSGSITENRSVSLDSVVENVSYPFSFPYSAVVYNSVSSKHFNNTPVRSYDCKLLKIRVPDNYDGEAREYVENWSGDFNRTLKWTNNPAWIFYDLCTNSRYGMAKGQIKETDLNKWQLLTLSKYCDELVKTNSYTKFASNIFYFDNSLKVGQSNYNCIIFSTSLSLEQLQQIYPFGSIIYLYDLKNKLDENIDYNYKKLICSVSVSGGIATLKLCNDFGPRKIMEQNLNGDLYKLLSSYVKDNPDENVEDKIKIFILKFFLGTTNVSLNYRSEDSSISVSHMSRKIFETSLNINKGYCVAKHSDYSDYLEPRFSCNVLINNEVEGLKALTDLSSIFRGMFYFKNGLLSLSSDVKQSPVYIFTNSNVRDGLFTYASGDLNTSFSVAKIPYLDKYDSFKDKIVYVEDSNLVRKFGIVEKEILSFGITSKSEAQRIGKWYLATGKLESEVVGFSTGFEATLLQIGNVIRISDSLKNASIVYGKITQLDHKNNYIYIDREVSEECLGKNIKIFSIINNTVSEFNFSVIEIDNTKLRLTIASHVYMGWFIVSNINVSNNGTTLSVGSITNAFNKKAYTTNSFVDNCQISYTSPNALTDWNVVGLSEVKNPTQDQTDIKYGFQILGTGTATLSRIQNGTTYPLDASYSNVLPTDVLKITYDGEYVRFYKNDTLVAGPINRTEKTPLYGVVAMSIGNSQIKNLNFSEYPNKVYGKYSDLRSGANFAIYINSDDTKNDLFKIVSINEVSSNEYAISAMKYEEEKFNIIENNSYVDKNQQKQIIFSTDKVINEIFNDSEVSDPRATKLSTVNYVTAASFDYDYSFYIEEEILNDGYFNSQYESIRIDFSFLFSILNNRGANNVFGIMCVINRNGKTLTFNMLKSNQSSINVFLGETQAGNVIYKTSLDFYAFDLNYKIFNV